MSRAFAAYLLVPASTIAFQAAEQMTREPRDLRSLLLIGGMLGIYLALAYLFWTKADALGGRLGRDATVHADPNLRSIVFSALGIFFAVSGVAGLLSYFELSATVRDSTSNDLFPVEWHRSAAQLIIGALLYAFNSTGDHRSPR